MVFLKFCFIPLLLLNECYEVHSNLAVVQKSVSTSGFHRSLSYSVVAHNVSGTICLLIEENLPPDIFVDPYQLAYELKSGLIQIDNSESINTENPAHRAKALKFKALLKSQDNIHYKLDLPIHLRYQKPYSCAIFGDKAWINLGLSNLYFNEAPAGISSNGACSIETTPWKHLEAETLEIKLELPVGCVEHFYIVFGVTLCFILVGSLVFYSQLLNIVT